MEIWWNCMVLDGGGNPAKEEASFRKLGETYWASFSKNQEAEPFIIGVLNRPVTEVVQIGPYVEPTAHRLACTIVGRAVDFFRSRSDDTKNWREQIFYGEDQKLLAFLKREREMVLRQLLKPTEAYPWDQLGIRLTPETATIAKLAWDSPDHSISFIDASDDHEDPITCGSAKRIQRNFNAAMSETLYSISLAKERFTIKSN